MNNSNPVKIHRIQTAAAAFERPTIKMPLEDIQVLLEIDASMKQREEHFEKTKHTRPTIQMEAVKI